MRIQHLSISDRCGRKQRRGLFYCFISGVNSFLLKSFYLGTSLWLRRRRHSAVREESLKETTGVMSASLPSVWALLWPVSLHNGCLALLQSQLSSRMTVCEELARTSFLRSLWIDVAFGYRGGWREGIMAYGNDTEVWKYGRGIMRDRHWSNKTTATKEQTEWDGYRKSLSKGRVGRQRCSLFITCKLMRCASCRTDKSLSFQCVFLSFPHSRWLEIETSKVY